MNPEIVSGKESMLLETTQRKLIERKTGVLVVGHGTRNAVGVRQLLELTHHIQALLNRANVVGCFLELAMPDIQQGIAQLKQSECESLIVVPVLLFTAAHAKDDIPTAVQGFAKESNIEVLGQTPSLGTHPLVLQLSASRFRTIDSTREHPCPVGQCAFGANPVHRCELAQANPSTCELKRWHSSGHQPSQSDIALAMVGRGTSDLQALDHMRQLTQLRTKLTPVGWVETGFFAGGKPSVDDLFAQAAEAPGTTVIVQPHLLFEGELMDKLREKLMDWRQKVPTKTWWMTGCLGADPELAGVFVGLLGEIVADW